MVMKTDLTLMIFKSKDDYDADEPWILAMTASVMLAQEFWRKSQVGFGPRRHI